MGNSNKEVLESIKAISTPITRGVDLCLKDCKDNDTRMRLIELRKTEVREQLKITLEGDKMAVKILPFTYLIPFDCPEAKEVISIFMGEEKDEVGLDKEEFKGQAEFTGGADKASCPLVELLKDKETMKELAFIFADAYFDTKHERFNNCGLKRNKASIHPSDTAFKVEK